MAPVAWGRQDLVLLQVCGQLLLRLPGRLRRRAPAARLEYERHRGAALRRNPLITRQRSAGPVLKAILRFRRSDRRSAREVLRRCGRPSAGALLLRMRPYPSRHSGERQDRCRPRRWGRRGVVAVHQGGLLHSENPVLGAEHATNQRRGGSPVRSGTIFFVAGRTRSSVERSAKPRPVLWMSRSASLAGLRGKIRRPSVGRSTSPFCG